MLKSYKTTLYFLLAVAVAVFFYFFYFETKPVVNDQSGVAYAYSTNAKGQEWGIQSTGGVSFVAGSPEIYPRFVLGSIDPIKVSVGDTQKMQIVVRDNVPVKRVWAEVENDKSTEVVELALSASSTVSYDTIQNQKYLVDSNGTLVINDGSNKNSVVTNIIQSLFRKASAENAMDYSYSGSWVVHDTRTVTYHTTFFAEDMQGRIRKLVLAWSDPCSFSGSNLTAYCNLAGFTDGVDTSGGINMNGNQALINTSGILAFNPGASIYNITPSAYINITQSPTPAGQIKKAYLYYTDADGDGYPASWTKNITSGVRVSSAQASLDCNDSQWYTHPNANWWAGTGTNTTNSITNDMNCNTVAEQGYAAYYGSYQTIMGYPSAVGNLYTCSIYLGNTVYYTYASGYSCGQGTDGGQSYYGGQGFPVTANLPTGYTGSWYAAVNSPSVACMTGSFLFYGSLMRVCR